MPLNVKVRAYSDAFNILVDDTLSPKARSEKIAAFARQEINKADEINRRALGAVPPKEITVNGREDESLSNVPPDRGTIIAEYELIRDVLEFIMDTLRARSPVLSGAYRDSHTMLADDMEADPYNPPLAAQFTFLNMVPYARKIEIGKTKSGRDFLIRVPNRIYYRTYQDAKDRFGNVAKITTGFTSTSASYRLKQNQAARSFAGGIKRVSARQRLDRVAGSVVTVPVIYVTIG